MSLPPWKDRTDRVLAALFPSAPAAAAAALAVSVLYGVALAGWKLLPVNDALVFAAVLVVVFLLLGRCPVRLRAITLHLATQVIVLSWVLNLWTLGYEGRNAIFGGILPWSDSFDYLNDALRLIHGETLGYAAKRPLFPVTLAALLRLFDGNLRLALLLLASFGAFAVALASDTVWRSHGRRAALIVCALALLSLRQWAGFVQTELIGLPLGLIGFALIWRATAGSDADTVRARTMVLAGLFAVTVALMARAGPFFILPALAAWSALHLVPAQSSRQVRLRHFAAALLAIAAGVLLHQAVLHIAASGASFSDYPAIVFGLIHHRDFTLLAETHPELNTLTGAARAAEAWRIVIAEALAHPGLVVAGLGRSFAELFYTPEGLFGFVWRNPDDMVLESGAAVRAAIAAHGVLGPVYLWIGERGLYSFLNALAMGALAIAFTLAAIAALIALYRRPADRFTTLLRWAIGGVLLSAPFTPPWITSSHQVETATLAFLAVTVATWRGRTGRPAEALAGRGLAMAPVGFAAAVAAAAIVLVAAPVKAPDGAGVMRLYPATVVRVVPQRTLNLTDRALGDLEFSIPYLKKHNPELVASLTPFLNSGTVYLLAYGRDGGTKILADDGGRLASWDGWQRIEGTPAIEPRVLHVTKAVRLD